MDKTLRFFSSGQTKDAVSTKSQNNVNKGMDGSNNFREMPSGNGKHIQNQAIDMKRKDSDNFFYIL